MNIEITIEELHHCDKSLTNNWEEEYKYAGGFQTSLMRTIEIADNINLRKLEKVYPNLVGLYLRWSRGGK